MKEKNTQVAIKAWRTNYQNQHLGLDSVHCIHNILDDVSWTIIWLLVMIMFMVIFVIFSADSSKYWSSKNITLNIWNPNSFGGKLVITTNRRYIYIYHLYKKANGGQLSFNYVTKPPWIAVIIYHGEH